MQRYKLDEIISNFSLLDKTLSNALREISNGDDSEKCVLSFAHYVKELLSRAFFAEKIKMLCCFIQAISYLLKRYDFNQMFVFIDSILHENEDITRKIRLLEKIYECGKFLNEILSMKVNTIINMIKNKTEKIDKQGGNHELLVYRYFLNSLENITDLWYLKITSYHSYRILKEKHQQVNSIGEVYEQLFGLHQYLNNINQENTLLKYNYINRNDDDMDEKTAEYLIELDKIINTLERTISNRKENMETTDHYSNELIIYYSSSLLEVASLRKITHHLAQYKIFKNIVEKEDMEVA